MAPLYCRLAMGSSHAVAILMAITLAAVGRALLASSRLAAAAACSVARPDPAPRCADSFDGCSDPAWVDRQNLRRRGGQGGAGYTLAGFVEAAREARRSTRRVFVVVYLFSGRQRAGDFESHFRRRAAAAGLEVLLLCIDITHDALWDLGQKCSNSCSAWGPKVISILLGAARRAPPFRRLASTSSRPGLGRCVGAVRASGASGASLP